MVRSIISYNAEVIVNRRHYMNLAPLNRSLIGIAIVAALFLQGCGGAGDGTVTQPSPGPNSTTKSNTALVLNACDRQLVGMSFTTFGASSKAPNANIAGGPYYSNLLQLWVVFGVSGSSFTETFYQNQAETQPAGTASYTLNIATQTLSGAINITQGPFSGLTGTYSQTASLQGTTGTYEFTLPSGDSVQCQFQLKIGTGGKPSGTATETVTLPNGYSEQSTTTYESNGSFKVIASDSNGYQSTFNFASDHSGTGTINGPDPGLPAKAMWDSTGTGKVTFADGLVISFVNWKLPTG